MIAAALWTQAISPTRAAITSENPECDFNRIYFAGDPNVPAQAAQYMATYKDVAARYCAFPELRQDSYWSVSPVWKSDSGVCLFEDLSRSYRIPIKSTFMTLAAGDCPKQNDPRYIVTKGVSQGTFAALLDFARRITSSRQSLESALSRAALAEAQAWGDFRADLLSRDPSRRLSVKAIKLSAYDTDLLSPTDHNLYTYELDLIEPNGKRGWTLYVDAAPTGFRIVNLSIYLLSHP